MISARRRKRRAAQRRHSSRSVAASALIVVMIIIGVALVGGATAGGIAAYSVVGNLNLDKLKPHYPGVNSKIYAANGQLLYTIPSTENRSPVKFDQMSPWLKKATIDIEDRRFYQHGGVDFEGIARAVADNLSAGHVVQGASTIEQQVVRNLYLNDDVSATRKLKEAWLAMQMSDEWSKDKILRTYMNVVPYGGVTYGCEAAAEAYYSTSCAKLGLTQAALIAGIPQSPTGYNPITYPAAAKERRNQVLAAMFNNNDINAGQYERAIRTGLKLDVPSQTEQSGVQSYWVQYVEQQLEQRYGQAAVREGGLSVKTTLQPQLQHAARVAMHEVLSGPGLPAAALVSIDPRTGAIVAFDATTNPEKAKFNIPGDAQRQAGSSFKPFALTAAMVYKHIDPETTTYSGSQPFQYQLCDTGYPSCTWTVYNAEQGGGNYDLHLAMDGSINTVFARLSIDIGADSTVRMAHRLGIPGSVKLPVVPSIVLGTGLVSPLDMASAYQSFAANGIHHQPLAITSVDSASSSKYDSSTPPSQNPGTRVIPSWTAWEMNNILRDNVTCAQGLCTGGGALLGDGRDEAGKTGTVETHQDAWFCGYTPTLVTCVWMGFPQGEISMVDTVGSGNSFGGGYPTTIWKDYMSQAFALNPRAFPPTPFREFPAPADAYQPFTSQFPLYYAPPPTTTTPPTKKNGGGGGGTTGGGGGGGTTGGGGGGGTTTTGGGGGGGTTTPPTT